MKKGKTMRFVAAAVAALLCLTACNGDYQQKNVTKIGLLEFSNVSEKDFFEKDDETEKANGTFAKGYDYGSREAVYFANLSTMLSALTAGQINYATMLDTSGDYVMKQNENTDKITLDDRDAFSMAVLADKTDLLNTLNGALSVLSSDGTLDLLAETYLVPEPPKAPEMPVFESGETIKVALTGDMPPLDYMEADGTPSGYNVALLSAVAGKAGINIELVSVDAGARITALSSGKADVVFWVRSDVDSGGNLVKTIDAPDTVSLTVPYRVENICMVYMKK